MKVVLVNPPDGNQVGRVANEIAIPPFGIASIAAVLLDDGFDVDMYDLALEWPLDVDRLSDLGFFDADVYGFSSYTSTFPTALLTVDLVRDRRPSAAIVFGGPHAGPSPQRILRHHAQIDAVISRDGEIPFLELVRKLADGSTDFADIPQLAYRGSLGGAAGEVDEVHVNAALAARVNRDDLPWPTRDFVIEPSRYVEEAKGREEPARVEFMLSSTGCPKRCTFCSIIVMQPHYRSRSAGSLLAEAKMLYAKEPYGQLRFVDANFLAQTPRVVDFARQLHAWAPEIRWSGTATADTVVRKRADVALIGSLNCHSLEIGIESGSDPVLERFGKGPDVATNEAAIAVLGTAGIELELDFIMFDPWTTLADIRRNLTFLDRNALSGTFPAHHIYNRLKLYPGTTDMLDYEERGGVADEDLDVVIVPPLRDPRVSLVYDGIERFRLERSERLAALVVALDIVFRSAAGHRLDERGAELRRAAGAMSLELRHAPQHVLAALVDAVAEYPDDALPEVAELVVETVRRSGVDALGERAQRLLAASVDAGLTSSPSTPAPQDPSSEQASRLSLVPVDSLVYVLDEDSGDITVLNETGAWLWHELRSSTSAGDTAGAYATWADLSADDADADVSGMVSRLRAARLLATSDQPGAGAETWSSTEVPAR